MTPKTPRHFPAVTSTTTTATTYTALCGLVSTDRKQFVDPRNYKVTQVTCEGCKGKAEKEKLCHTK
jgi:hypothetical protein